MLLKENAEECEILHIVASDAGALLDFAVEAQKDLMRHQVTKPEVQRLLRRAEVVTAVRDNFGRIRWVAFAEDLDGRVLSAACFVDFVCRRITVLSLTVVE